MLLHASSCITPSYYLTKIQFLIDTKISVFHDTQIWLLDLSWTDQQLIRQERTRVSRIIWVIDLWTVQTEASTWEWQTWKRCRAKNLIPYKESGIKVKSILPTGPGGDKWPESSQIRGIIHPRFLCSFYSICSGEPQLSNVRFTKSDHCEARLKTNASFDRIETNLPSWASARRRLPVDSW